MYGARYMLEYILNLDKYLFVLINSQWTTNWGDLFFPAITDLHKSFFFKTVIVPVILALFIWRRGLKKGLIIFCFCVVGIAISDGVGNFAFKKTVQRARPAETQGLAVKVRSSFGGYSFVSNHSVNMFNFAAFTSTLFPAATVPTFTLAFLIAYSRVYNGVHFPTDVIAGGLLGFIFGLIFANLCLRYFVSIERKKGPSEKVGI